MRQHPYSFPNVTALFIDPGSDSVQLLFLTDHGAELVGRITFFSVALAPVSKGLIQQTSLGLVSRFQDAAVVKESTDDIRFVSIGLTSLFDCDRQA